MLTGALVRVRGVFINQVCSRSSLFFHRAAFYLLAVRIIDIFSAVRL